LETTITTFNNNFVLLVSLELTDCKTLPWQFVMWQMSAGELTRAHKRVVFKLLFPIIKSGSGRSWGG